MYHCSAFRAPNILTEIIHRHGNSNSAVWYDDRVSKMTVVAAHNQPIYPLTFILSLYSFGRCHALYWALGRPANPCGCLALSSLAQSTTVETSGLCRGSSVVKGCDVGAVWGGGGCSFIVFLDTEVQLRPWSYWSSVLRRVTPLTTSPYLCFPCKVWGLSKQTGGDKHMLWTALCWVVSEVQQSRSLSGCGYTSHSELDSRTGALLLPHWW